MSNTSKTKKLKRLSDREVRRISNTKKKHGDDFFVKNGSKAGKKSTTKFNSESGRAAIKKRWADHRKKKGNQNGQSKQS